MSLELDYAGSDDFTASNGWLNSWQKRYNINFALLSGESAQVSQAAVDDWMERLHTITEGMITESCSMLQIGATPTVCVFVLLSSLFLSLFFTIVSLVFLMDFVFGGFQDIQMMCSTQMKQVSISVLCRKDL
jgi:hypothetical protein